MGWVEVFKQLDMASHQSVLRSEMPIESFTWCGVPCELGRGHRGANGYVYPPLRVRRRLAGLNAYSVPFDVHGGVTFCSLQFSCLGFDTVHAGDWWPTDEAIKCASDPDEARHVFELIGNEPPPKQLRVVWSLDRVRVETRHLAEQVAALNYVVAWRPAQRAARRALREARRKGDV